MLFIEFRKPHLTINTHIVTTILQTCNTHWLNDIFSFLLSASNITINAYWPRFLRLTTLIILTYLSTTTIYCTVTHKDSLDSQHSQTHSSWVQEASHHNNTDIVTSILKTLNTHRPIDIFSFLLRLTSQHNTLKLPRFLRLTILTTWNVCQSIQYSVTQKDSWDSQHSQTHWSIFRSKFY